MNTVGWVCFVLALFCLCGTLKKKKPATKKKGRGVFSVIFLCVSCQKSSGEIKTLNNTTTYVQVVRLWGCFCGGTHGTK